MEFNLINFLGFLVFTQLLFITFFLFTHRSGKVTANRILATFFLLLSFNVLDGIITINGLYLKYPDLAGIEEPFALLYGPLIMVYTNLILYKDYKLDPSHLLHSIPFIIVLGYVIFSFHIKPEFEKLDIITRFGKLEVPLALYFIVLGINLHFLVYIGLSKIEIHKYRKAIRSQFSQYEKLSMSWLSFMLNSFIIILAASMLTTALVPMSNPLLTESLLLVSVVFIFIFIYQVVLKGLRQPQLFSGIEVKEVSIVTDKYKSSNISKEQAVKIELEMDKLIESEKLFLNSTLTINDFAEKLNTHPRTLSQVINERKRMNFYEFVNEKRIMHAISLLESSNDSKQTILEIAYASGFNSKSSFNAFFKRATGQTPSHYKNQLKKRIDS